MSTPVRWPARAALAPAPAPSAAGPRPVRTNRGHMRMSEQPSRVTAPPAHTAEPSAPVRRSIASFPSYAEAEQAVDALSDRGFPVERVAVVGRELELVEQVTGRLDYPRAALRGAAGGGGPGARAPGGAWVCVSSAPHLGGG